MLLRSIQVLRHAVGRKKQHQNNSKRNHQALAQLQQMRHQRGFVFFALIGGNVLIAHDVVSVFAGGSEIGITSSSSSTSGAASVAKASEESPDRTGVGEGMGVGGGGNYKYC